ncbi:D-aminoacyl-tRNA deacylase [Pseudalkalibacillus salsuginis]|uniref:D-aminoacyl-tRNA deacylase n=1 Tax=Pseudalkalibacillus salsuginis TaxID=2910972 RepID=UPI001F159000|nr:D-aminoacyl-tRNA deacylase [Pseudalkalibacillus salsuginis]MCF6408626.1 D-aminoacyl-tRNA deacylase [Pseudalkalibacillus salsuginis]
MRIVVQRVTSGEVIVKDQTVGQIEQGLVLLVGISHEDTTADVKSLAEKIPNLRIFEDREGKMNLSLIDIGGAILSVSQFTLHGDCRKGRRPNFMSAAKPEKAQELYEEFNSRLRDKGIQVETGKFGALMDVRIHNNGPVTLILDTVEMKK